MSVDGAGIGKYEGMTFFVKDALIGDRARVRAVKLKKTWGYARMMELLSPSPDRAEPPCPYHRQCGGCQIQALSYEKQLEFKQRKVENNLCRIGGFDEIPMEPIVGMENPFHYRNKSQYPVGTDKNGAIITGFYAGRTHQIIPNRDCALGVPVNREILDIVISHMERYHVSAYDEITGQGLVRHVLIRYGFRTKEIMVCLIINGT
ncbi:MAG: 23S rRNA (uracil(1939)-C(5))-methyltransferase RlmD, partial [Clostridiales bacterium]|nr:23S rRNA (uracil(1939)-C(5))-methyltransferase RlmD [Clostridiales bacterium]